MLDKTFVIGPLEIPYILIILMVSSLLCSVIYAIVIIRKSNRTLAENHDKVKIIGEGVEFIKMDGESATVHAIKGKNVIFSESGKHELLVVGSQSTHNALTRTTKNYHTKQTPVMVTLEPGTTYKLIFKKKSGFNISVAKKQL